MNTLKHAEIIAGGFAVKGTAQHMEYTRIIQQYLEKFGCELIDEMGETPMVDAAFHRYNATAEYTAFREECRDIERKLNHAREALRTSIPQDVAGARAADYRYLESSFKAFHKRLCERFSYGHDENDWQRDLASLEEHIAKKLIP